MSVSSSLLSRSRRRVLLALAAFAALALGACDGGGTEEAGDDTADTGATPDTTGGADTAQIEDSAQADTGSDAVDDVAPSCTYPMHDEFVQLGKIMPHLRWDRAFLGDGTEISFDLEDFFCDDEAWGRYNTLTFFVVAEWCPACNEVLTDFDETRYLDRVDAAGGLVLIVEAETTSYVPATSEEGFASVSSMLADHTGVIVGDADTTPGPAPSSILRSPLIGSFPGGFVVRRSDMRVITDVKEGDFFVDLESVALDPDSFYMGPPTDTGPTCGAPEEEASEAANDAPAGAVVIEPDTLTMGGICNDQPDFWRIDEPGNWLLQLSFDATVGDLDFYLWDEANDTYLLDALGRRIGSAETGPGEVFQFCGPALVRVFGYNGSTAPYTLTMSSLGGTSCN